MKEDALSRLDGIAEDLANAPAKPVFSVEEQMESAKEDEDMFSEMSAEAKDNLLGRVKEVTLDEPTPIPPEEQLLSEVKAEEKPVEPIEPKKPDEELFNCNSNVKNNKRGRPSKSKTETKGEQSDTNGESLQYNPIMDKLAKDIIADLRKNKYSINGFDNNLMQIVFNYMQDKF